MKTFLKQAAFSLTGVLLGSCAFAQTTAPDANYVKPFSGDAAFRTWSIGINVGVLSTYTPLQNNSRQDFMTTQAQLGYGAYIKKQITPSFGIQADYLGGKIEAANSAMRGAPFNNSAYTKVSTTVQYAASLSAHYNMANLNWHYKTIGIQPYFTAGVGLMGYKPVLTPSDGNPSISFKANNESVQELFIPVGAGFKLNVAKGVNIDLGYKVAFLNSDNLDGYNYAANNDRFSYGHIGLEFALGAKSKPQLATHNPVNSLRNEYLMEEQRLQMAIDAQKAALDAQKAANDQLRADLNATNANLAKFSADSDGDGVPDFFDKCPGTASGTKVDGSGCPLPVAAPAPRPDVRVIVTEQDRRIVNEAIKNLEFDFGKSTIRAKSFPSLDRVAALLVEKNFSLKLAGHTDNVGSNDANLNLSKDRAESVKTYLVGKGANASRIEATGYGETQPIATNKTAAGRQKNRRVEFTLF